MSTGIRDRLTFEEGRLDSSPDAPDADGVGNAPRRSRGFVYVAIAMGGLVLLGIMALVAVLMFWLPEQREQQSAAVTGTVSAMTRAAAAWTPTPLPSATPLPPTFTPTSLPTETPVPTPTSTRVVAQGQVEGQGPTRTPVLVEQPGTTPAAGLGVGGTAAAVASLLGLLVAARKLRGA